MTLAKRTTGIRKNAKEVNQVKKKVFERAIKILNDPSRISKVDDATILKLAAAWGMQAEKAQDQKEGAAGPQKIVFISNIPDNDKPKEVVDITPTGTGSE